MTGEPGSYDPKANFMKMLDHLGKVGPMMERFQSDLSERTFEGTDHDGMVTVRFTADYQDVAVQIDDVAMEHGDAAGVASRIEAAFADAGAKLRQVADGYQEEAEAETVAPLRELQERWETEERRRQTASPVSASPAPGYPGRPPNSSVPHLRGLD